MMTIEDKHSRRREEILKAVTEALFEIDFHQLTVEEVAARAGVGKSTIYRWWKNKSDLILDTFQFHTASIFELDLTQSLETNLNQQLNRLARALYHPVGRALLVVLANHRELAGDYFKQYLLPKREQMHVLIHRAIERQEIKPTEQFDLMLDSLYGPIHYQIIFFNKQPDEAYIQKLVQQVLLPIRR